MKKETTSSRLKQIMIERGLKQIDIVRLCEPFCKMYGIKMGRNDVSQYVSGKVIPKQDKLTILGMALNVSESWLMGYDVYKETSVSSKSKLIQLIEKSDLTYEEEEKVITFINYMLFERKK